MGINDKEINLNDYSKNHDCKLSPEKNTVIDENPIQERFKQEHQIHILQHGEISDNNNLKMDLESYDTGDNLTCKNSQSCKLITLNSLIF